MVKTRARNDKTTAALAVIVITRSDGRRLIGFDGLSPVEII